MAAVATGRVDNGEELIGQLRTPGGHRLPRGVSDAELLRSAYRRWQSGAPARMFGAWALAAWDARRQQLFLARDHFRGRHVYTFTSPRLFAFATSLDVLLRLDAVPTDPDDLFMAQVLISWAGALGDRTAHRHIRVLPPAHSLTLSAKGIDVRRYWRMEDVPELRLASRAGYVEGFREVFDAAVRARLPGSGPTGITLSGGLDSSAVAATAASCKRTGESLIAFTSVPMSDPSVYVSAKRFGDELDLASTIAQAIGPVELVPVRGTTWSPVEAIRKALDVHNEPIHAAGNLYWLLDIFRAADARGCSTLLTGQMGNAGVSWTGDPLCQSLRYQLTNLGPRSTAHAWLRRTVPSRFVRARRRRRVGPAWHRGTAIAPQLAARLDLLERRLADPNELPPRSPLEVRLRILGPKRSGVSACLNECGRAMGVELLDPTGDARVLSYVLSIPDRIFIDPDTGLDRWLIRSAMKGQVPDPVRLNRRRGQQAGDLVPRLRASASDVESTLDELGAGAAADYLDVPHMRDAWRTVQSVDTTEAHRLAVSVLTRGFMVGLCVNRISTNARSEHESIV